MILALQTDDEEESFILEDPFLLNIDNTDTHSYDTSSVASSDSGDRTHLKRYCSLMPWEVKPFVKGYCLHPLETNPPFVTEHCYSSRTM